MSKICPLCGGVTEFAGKNWYGESVFECTVCHALGYYQGCKEPLTVFQQITQSPEMLAPLLIWQDYDWCVFRSNIIESKGFDTKEEAIAATVAKLKEVAE